MKRMDRYEVENDTERLSRSNKNQDLYENIGKNKRYTNLADVSNVNAYEINPSTNNSTRTRENYQKMREYSNIVQTPKVKRDLDEFKNVYKERENRVYDINSVIAEARKNKKIDVRDEKRKLKHDKYNVLINLDKEELEEYRRQRQERYMHPDEEELHELIDTIASKTLAGEIDKNTSVNLLSELMATSILDQVQAQAEGKKEEEEETKENVAVDVEVKVDEEPKEEVEEKPKDDYSDFINTRISSDDVEKINAAMEEMPIVEETPKGLDNDFYNGSKDLSNDDIDSEMFDDFNEKKLPTALKVFFFLIIIAVLGAAVYFAWQMKLFNLDFIKEIWEK